MGQDVGWPLDRRVWEVGELCQAIADSLRTNFDGVTVRGEVSGFARAVSGHCYFSIKDGAGQLRCAMFKRVSNGLDFEPRDGQLVDIFGRLGLYETRGDLQLIVESMVRVGLGGWFEQFCRLKAKLEAEGLFVEDRKRRLPIMPRAIGLVTSSGAAALRDVVATLQRRVPHIPVVFAPASVQGSGAPGELVQALSHLYRLASGLDGMPRVDVILLVRGGGSIEDLWAFNDEQLARAIVRSPVPLISGVGHETDFTIADFVADLRAPTPTAAAELVSESREVWLAALLVLMRRWQDALRRHLDRHGQRLDMAAVRLGRPAARLVNQRLRLAGYAQSLHSRACMQGLNQRQRLDRLAEQWLQAWRGDVWAHRQRLDRAALRLESVDPHRVLRRGYAWLSDRDGKTITWCRQVGVGQEVTATLVDGTVDLTVVRVSDSV